VGTIGLRAAKVTFTDLAYLPTLVEPGVRRSQRTVVAESAARRPTL